MENNNKIDFDENKPYLAPHNPFTLEGHWQPWYDDRKDYSTNAPSYFDYLANFNHLIKSIVDLLNRVARRNIKVEDTPCIDMTKINDWIDEGNECHTWHDVITLKCEVILSTYKKAINFDGNDYTLSNIISCLNDGLYSPDYLPFLTHLKNKLNQEIEDRKNADNALNAKIDKEISDRTNADNALNAKIDKEISDRTNADNNLRKHVDKEVSRIVNRISQILSDLETLTNKVNNNRTALQKIVTNLYEGGNATSNDINNFNINNHIAAGNINLYGGTPDGNSLIRTHNGQAENDVTVGSRG